VVGKDSDQMAETVGIQEQAGELIMTTREWLMISVLSVLVCGCASMSKDECKTANWEIVGFDDGSHGRNESNIKRYQEDCAGVVTPNLTAYRQGHARGVASYCVAGSGYSSGIRGYKANNVCDPARFPDYYQAQQAGLTIFQSEQDINKQTANLQQAYQARADAEYDIKVVEAKLVAPGLSSNERLQLLVQSQQMRKDLQGYVSPIVSIEQQLGDAIQRHNSMLASNPYEKRPFVNMPSIKIQERPDPLLVAQQQLQEQNKQEHHEHKTTERHNEAEAIPVEAFIVDHSKDFSLNMHPGHLIKDRGTTKVADRDLWRIAKRDNKFLAIRAHQYQLFRIANNGSTEIEWTGYSRSNSEVHIYYWDGHKFLRHDGQSNNADSDYTLKVDLPERHQHIYVLVNSTHGGLYTDEISAHLIPRHRHH